MLQVNNIKEDSIIELFCKPFDKLNKTTNDESTLSFIFYLLYMDIYKYNSFLDETQLQESFIYNAIYTRAEFLDLNVDDKTLVFFCVLCENSFGKMAMYITYLKYMSNLLEMPFMSLMDVCDIIFPLGFPTDDDMIQLWNNLKYDNENNITNNLLDNEFALKSLTKVI